MAKKTFLILLGSLILTGCAGTMQPPAQLALKDDGYISINRLAPQVSQPTTMLGFVPVESEKGKWLSVDTTKGTISLMEGTNPVAIAHGEGAIKLSPGSYQLMHKQRSPLWYAGDTYFSKRGLPIPAAGDKERYRRGALGDFALFIDKDTSLHSALVWSDEVGGLRINDLDLRKIYYSLDVGSRIEIK